MDNTIDKQLQVIDGEMTPEEAAVPTYDRLYQVIGNTKIQVSKSTGKFWSIRKDEIQKLNKTRGYEERWSEAISYYQHDQGGKTSKRSTLGEVSTGKANQRMLVTENIVFANASALLPAIYAKNPDIEITSSKPDDEGNEKKAKLFEGLLDTLINRKVDPGINLKPKMRRASLTTILTNISYLVVSYVRKEDGSEAAMEEIRQLSDELEKATKIDDIRDIEGKLIALETKVNFLSASGPKVRTVHPKYILRDPEGVEPDLSDCQYVIVGELIRTSYLRACYGNIDENGEWRSIYSPTHVMLSDNRDVKGHDEEINNFSLLDEGAEHSKYGYKSQEEFDENCRTLVWTVWDKTTRRVMMFHDKDWSWPIWVWDDPYKLTRFFPIFPLAFYSDPEDVYGRSEVMYYLDQQDEINQINNERARMRHWAMTKIFVNKNLVKNPRTIEKFLNADDTDNFVHAIDLPENTKITDVIGTMPLPSMQYEQLFDPRSQFESINRMSSVTPTLQAQQYKTNTTNKAIESYESTTQTRLDEKIDAIEDVMGDVATAVLEMCVQFMTSTEVEDLLGTEFVEANGGWENYDNPAMIHKLFNLKIVGGSTLKPTSKVKKELAMNLGQILGQFASASPVVVLVMLKMMERAFGEDIVITPAEWESIVASIQQAAQPQQQQAQSGAAPTQGAEGEQALIAAVDQVSQIFDQIPAQGKQEVGKAIAEGIPLKQIISAIVQKLQGDAQAQQPTQQPAQPTQGA